MTDNDMNIAICKALEIDATNVERVVLLLQPDRAPRVRITRVRIDIPNAPQRTVRTYTLVSKYEKPMTPLSIADTVDALQGFEVSKRGDA